MGKSKKFALLTALFLTATISSCKKISNLDNSITSSSQVSSSTSSSSEEKVDYKNVFKLSKYQNSGSDYYYIDGLKDANITNLVIPNEIDGIPVYRIETDAFSGNKNIKTVSYLAESVRIYKNAFKDCTNLVEFKFSESSKLAYIGESAFENCTSLKEFVYPTEKATNGYGYMTNDYVFKGCTSLERVVLFKDFGTINASYFDKCFSLKEVSFHKGGTAEKNLKVNSNNITSISGTSLYLAWNDYTLSNTITYIGNFAFCPGLSNKDLDFVLPTKVTYVGDYAFKNCIFKSFTLNHKPTFASGYGASSDSDERFANKFLCDTTIEKVYINATIPFRKTYFKNAHIENLYLGTGVTTFEEYSSFAETDVPTDIKDIYVLANTDNLYTSNGFLIAKMTDSSGKTVKRAIAEFGRYEEYYFPNDVTQIGMSLFKNNDYVKKVYMSDNITSFYANIHLNGSFNGCANLEEVRLSDNLTEIKQSCFINLPKLRKINIPKNMKNVHSIVSTFYDLPNLEEITIPANHQYYKVVNGCLIGNSTKNIDGTSRAWYRIDAILKDATIPETADLILFGESGSTPYYKYFKFKDVENLVLPTNIKYLQSFTNEYTKTFKTSTDELNILSGTTIFSNSSTIESIELSKLVKNSDTSYFTEVKTTYLFNNAPNLKEVKINMTKDEFVTFVESVNTTQKLDFSNFVKGCPLLTKIKFLNENKDSYIEYDFADVKINQNLN